MPIILLSAVGDEEEKVRALEAGADDYVVKPFAPRELVARLQAVLRRAGDGPGEPAIVADGLVIDLAARTVTLATAPRSTSRRSSSGCCARSPAQRGRLMTHRALLVEVWGPATRTTRRSCARTSRTCGARSSRRAARRATSARSPASATASRPDGLHEILMPMACICMRA